MTMRDELIRLAEAWVNAYAEYWASPGATPRKWSEAKDAFRAYVDTLQPDGRHVVVPIEPTDAMLKAFADACDEHGHCLVKTGYRAMIQAAAKGGE